MIKTLRITSVVAAILAGAFFVFPVIYGVRSDVRIDEFLKLPSVKEKFENAADTKTKTGESQESPLVKQAEAYALYLNPVKPPVKRTLTKGKIPGISDNVNVTPKFTVYATIVCPENPELSQALINEPGRGRHWVRQSSMVGHLLIEQVKDGFVVAKSGKETYNLEVGEKTEAASPGKASSASSLSRTGKSSAKPTSTSVRRTPTNVTSRNISQRGQRNSSDEERMDQLVDKLKDLQQSSDSENDNEEKNARIQELISKFKSTRVSAEESKKLDNMGEELKGIEEDPNSLPSEADDNEADEDEEQAKPPKLDKSAKK